MDDASSEIARLEEEVETLEVELEAARIRTEIALTMPHLLKNHLDKEREAREAAEAAGTAASAEAGMGMGLPERGKAGKKKRRQ